jgi:activating signal cointegrator complex subunit 3
MPSRALYLPLAPQDVADWLGVGPRGLFNFKPSVRPVPLEAHIQGYPGPPVDHPINAQTWLCCDCSESSRIAHTLTTGVVVPAGKLYCPRMASMNKPTYAAIQVCH